MVTTTAQAPVATRNQHNDAIDGSALIAELYREAIAWHLTQVDNLTKALNVVEGIKALPRIPADDFRPAKERGKGAFSDLLKRLPMLGQDSNSPRSESEAEGATPQTQT